MGLFKKNPPAACPKCGKADGWRCMPSDMAQSMDANAAPVNAFTANPVRGSIGASMTVAGIVCLSVGYTRMHKSVNLYNIEKAHRPDLRWVLALNNQGGMSVAMQF